MLLDTIRITESKRIDPTAYLEGRGFTVRKEGRHLSVRSGQDERYRITQKPDGHWVTCDKRGQGVGDNIALVRDLEPALGFLDAVARLAEGPVVKRELLPEPSRRERPARLPQTRADRHAGRVYLQGRGISPATLDHAERTGFLRYAGGGVLFVGRDANGGLRNVGKRLIAPGPDDQPKRDLAGSDKTYPPILPGNPRVVWIVEGASMPWRRGTWRSGAARPRPPCWSAAGPGSGCSSTTRPCKPSCCRPIRWWWRGTTKPPPRSRPKPMRPTTGKSRASGRCGETAPTGGLHRKSRTWRN